MKLKRLSLLLVPFLMVACNNSSVNKTKSPFNDSFNPIGMNGQYNITDSLTSEEYYNLKKSIKNYSDNNSNYIVSSYTRDQQTRDLKAAYFGKNLGAANLCLLTHRIDTNTRYKNLVTTKFQSTHKEEQIITGGITKTNPVVNEYIFGTTTNNYQTNQQTWNDNEEKVTKKIDEGTYTSEEIDKTFGLKAYGEDIYTHFNKEKEEVTGGTKKAHFCVLGDDNNAVYGKTSDGKYLVKEAVSIFDPYSTTVGDTYKAAYNFFYEALLEKNGDQYRFTNFRFYTELLILSEAYSDETKVPVLYLEKPQLVEYSEVTYVINYVNDINSLSDFTGEIPTPTEE